MEVGRYDRMGMVGEFSSVENNVGGDIGAFGTYA